jgi:sulfopyruvate decarboxylase subunit alpha
MMASEQQLHGAGLIEALKDAGISHVVSVPDLTTSEGVLRPLASDTGLKLVRVCREEEGVGICAGLAMAGRRGAMLIQYTGFLASMNAIRAIAMEYRQPICMLVGMLFTDSPEDPSKSHNYGVSRMVPLLEAMGLRYHIVACDGDVPAVAPALARAFRESEPVAILSTRYPSP